MVRVVGRKYGRSTVSAGQIKVLDLVHKYRFVSRYLLADSLEVRPENGLYEKLEVLVKYGYLAKRFEKRLKLQAVPVAYYLTPKGLRILQGTPNHEYVTDAVIKASYKDKSVGQEFITHTLDVYKYTNLLKKHYPGLKVFTKRELGAYDYFPSQLPDAFLSLPTGESKPPRRFFFDLIPNNQPRIALDRHIANYCEFFDDGGWDETGSDIPVILLLSTDKTKERQVQRAVRAQLNSSGMEELLAYTSTVVGLEKITETKAVWTNVEDIEELLEFTTL